MSVALTLVVATAILVIYAVRKYYARNGDFWKKRGVYEIDADGIAPVWKRLTQLVPFADFDHAVYKALGDEKYGGFVELGNPVLYIKDLDLLKRIFVKDFEHFVDRRIIDLDKSDKIFGNMLTNKTGREWKDLRAAMSPAFTTGKIKKMFQFFNACGHQMATYLKESGKEEIDFQDAFGRYTLGAIASIAFGLEADTFRAEDTAFRKMAKRMQTFTPIRFAKLIFFILLPKLAKLLRLAISEPVSIKFFSSLLEHTMNERRETGQKRQDFLQLMLDAQAGQLKMDEKEVLDTYEKDAQLKDTGNSKKDSAAVFDDDTILSQAILFFFAGSDTLESLLTFAAYELAMHPDVQEKLAEEVTPVMEENDGNISYEAVQDMEYLDMVVHETLRLHPPAFGTERHCTQEYTIPESNVSIPVGTRIVISINGVHKDENNYAEPLKFNPENFSSENKAKRHPYSWLPFGQGPRNCIAMRFALIEAKAAIAHLAYNFKVEPCDKTPKKIVLSKKTTIRKPADGMWLKFSPRENRTNGFVKL